MRTDDGTLDAQLAAWAAADAADGGQRLWQQSAAAAKINLVTGTSACPSVADGARFGLNWPVSWNRFELAGVLPDPLWNRCAKTAAYVLTQDAWRE